MDMQPGSPADRQPTWLARGYGSGGPRGWKILAAAKINERDRLSTDNCWPASESCNYAFQDNQSRLHLTMAVFPSFPISVFSILLFYLPTQFSLILVVAFVFFLLESRSHQKLLFVPTLRTRFARCCFWSATFLIAAKISLHIFLNIHARIEQAFHFALAHLCLPQLFAVQALGIILCDGDRMHRLYFNLRLYLERNNDPASTSASTSDTSSKLYPLFN
jgi:hypothetical protein